MDWIDILKIVTPIILFMMASLGGALKWILDREEKTQEKEDKAQKEYWETVHDSLQQLVSELSTQFKEHKGEQNVWRENTSTRINLIETRFSEFREYVAATHIKRDDWLNHAVNLERKVDNLRNDFHKELQDIVRSIAELGKKS